MWAAHLVPSCRLCLVAEGGWILGRPVLVTSGLASVWPCDLGVGGFLGAVQGSLDFPCGPEAFDPVSPPSVWNLGLRGMDGFQGERRL